MTMTPSRPYIVRALYEWIVDNNCTPYILVNAYGDGVEVPQQHVKDGQIILNISPMAVQGLSLGDDRIDFDGRFSGISTQVSVPIASVLGIYAKENGQGMIFDPEGVPPMPPKPPGTDEPEKSDSGTQSPAKPGGKKPPLRLVK
jgi:stringent starvation protein B